MHENVLTLNKKYTTIQNMSNDIWSYTEDNQKLPEPVSNFSSNLNNFPFWEKIKDNKYTSNKKIIVKQSSPQLGLGVFAVCNIKENELIEKVPLIQMAWKSNYLLEPQILNYCWINSSCQCEDCKRHGYSMYLALGYGGIYNHNDNPNASTTHNFKNLIMDITSKREIKKGEEIFIDYGPNYFKRRPKF
jgi:SET domain-containing protein